MEDIKALIIEPTQWMGFLEMLDENKTAEIMKTDARGTIVAFLKHNNIPVIKENVIKYCFQSLALWTGVCTTFRQYVDEQGYTHLVFDHPFNLKWSRIVAEVFSDLITVVLNIPTEAWILPNTVEIKLLERD